jgi:4-hydroxy-tetrahydrodipicolinate synthase
MIFQGSGVAICTPFNSGGVNYDTFERLIRLHLDEGTDALVVCGTTGEPSTMTAEEKHGAIQFAVRQVNGRIPIIAGVGGNNTADVLESAKRARDCGADALLAVTPYYNKCSKAGLRRHFLALADATDLPIVIYNVPSRTAVNMDAQTFCELAEHKNIAAVKEASANISQIADYARLCRGKADLYSGNDDHIVPLLSLGGIGVISVLANIMPRYTHDMVMAFLNGDAATARDMQLEVNPLVGILFCEVNPIPVKTALDLMGYDMGGFRLPLCEKEPQNAEKLKIEMDKLGLLK